MNIVADTNVFLAVVLGQPERFRIISQTRGHDLIAPSVLPFEIGNALSALAKRNGISVEDAAHALQAVQKIAVELRDVDLRSSLDIALRYNIYAYDAYFLDCALTSKSPILTLDKGMRRVARELRIEVLE